MIPRKLTWPSTDLISYSTMVTRPSSQTLCTCWTITMVETFHPLRRYIWTPLTNPQRWKTSWANIFIKETRWTSCAVISTKWSREWTTWEQLSKGKLRNLGRRISMLLSITRSGMPPRIKSLKRLSTPRFQNFTLNSWKKLDSRVIRMHQSLNSVT